jgi:hypothetical protein
MAGTIVFPGSPWPEGHALEEVVWCGHLDDRGLWFDFHMRSVSYPRSRGDEDEEVDSDWRAPSVWQNYGRCTLSTLQWPGVFTGIRVGDAERPFDMSRLSRVCAEPLPARATMHHLDGPDRSVGLYLFAHGTAADHDLRFTRRGKAFDLIWRARIAHAFGKPEPKAFASPFSNSLELRASGLRFGGFQVAERLPIDVAKDLIQIFTTDAGVYTYDVRHERFDWRG